MRRFAEGFNKQNPVLFLSDKGREYMKCLINKDNEQTKLVSNFQRQNEIYSWIFIENMLLVYLKNNNVKCMLLSCPPNNVHI